MYTLYKPLSYNSHPTFALGCSPVPGTPLHSKEVNLMILRANTAAFMQLLTYRFNWAWWGGGIMTTPSAVSPGAWGKLDEHGWLYETIHPPIWWDFWERGAWLYMERDGDQCQMLHHSMENWCGYIVRVLIHAIGAVYPFSFLLCVHPPEYVNSCVRYIMRISSIQGIVRVNDLPLLRLTARTCSSCRTPKGRLAFQPSMILGAIYCWWKKSCTTWHAKIHENHMNSGIFTISTRARFLP